MESSDQYLNIAFTPRNVDRYFVRASILNALTEAAVNMKGILLDVGCGYMPYKPLLMSPHSSVERYIGLDLIDNKYAEPDLTWDGNVIPLTEASVDCAIATEVFEHCPRPEVVMKEIHRVLKPGGLLFFTVPFLWNLHDVPYDEYRYTPFALERLLRDAGFLDIHIKATGGWDASLAQMLGLWARRRWQGEGYNRILRLLFSTILSPVVWLLYQVDQAPQEFSNGTMLTGITGIAIKQYQ